MKNRNGFTIGEIMFVVAIFAILFMVAVPSIRKARATSQRKQVETQLEIIAAAIQQLAWDTGRWPRALPRNVAQGSETWDLSTADAGILATDGDFKGWLGPYAKEVPLDPWGRPYFFDPDYKVKGVNRIVVGSFGPNGGAHHSYDRDNIYIFLDD